MNDNVNNTTLMKTLPPPLKKNVSGWPWDEPVEVNETLETYPTISITVPSYFHAGYLEESLRSILLQQYPNLELFVMDGGSTDKTVEILEYYNEFITQWVSEKDDGQAAAVNKGFQQSTGDLITYQHSDDFYLPGVFHEVAKLYNDNPDAGVFAGGFYFMDPASKRIGVDIPSALNVQPPADLTLGPPGAYRIHQAAAFFSKKAMEKVGKYVREDLNFTIDRELLYRIVREFPVVLADKTFAAFRKHPDSKSTNSIRPFAREYAELHLQFKNGKPAEDRKREAMAKHRLYRGEIQYAKLSDTKLEKVSALINAAKFKPSAVFQGKYLKLWAKLLIGRM